LDNKMSYSPEQMDAMYQKLAIRSASLV